MPSGCRRRLPAWCDLIARTPPTAPHTTLQLNCACSPRHAPQPAAMNPRLPNPIQVKIRKRILNPGRSTVESHTLLKVLPGFTADIHRHRTILTRFCGCGWFLGAAVVPACRVRVLGGVGGYRAKPEAAPTQVRARQSGTLQAGSGLCAGTLDQQYQSILYQSIP